MRLGPQIRRLFGPYERQVAEAYKRVFIDLDDFAGRLRLWVPHPARILEVGCGEGAMMERLATIYTRRNHHRDRYREILASQRPGIRGMSAQGCVATMEGTRESSGVHEYGRNG